MAKVDEQMWSWQTNVMPDLPRQQDFGPLLFPIHPLPPSTSQAIERTMTALHYCCIRSNLVRHYGATEDSRTYLRAK